MALNALLTTPNHEHEDAGFTASPFSFSSYAPLSTSNRCCIRASREKQIDDQKQISIGQFAKIMGPEDELHTSEDSSRGGFLASNKKTPVLVNHGALASACKVENEPAVNFVAVRNIYSDLAPVGSSFSFPEVSVTPADDQCAVQRICGDAACEPALVPAALHSEIKIETQEQASWSPAVAKKNPIADVEREHEICSELFSRTSTNLLASLKSLRTMRTNAQGAPAQVATGFTPFNYSDTLFFNREARIEGGAASASCRDAARLLKAIKPPALENTPKSPFVIVSDEGRKRKLSSLNAVALGRIPAQHEIGETARRRIRRSKDKPRRPLSAYNLFFREERNKVANAGTAQGLALGYGDMSRIVSNRWKQLSDEDAKPFKHEAAREQILYRRAIDAYLRI
jgi:hypothetical protein